MLTYGEIAAEIYLNDATSADAETRSAYDLWPNYRPFTPWG
jgi:hypothetical protein